METSRARVQVASFARSFVEIVRDKEITFLAASLAYYAFVSLVPLLLLLIALISVTGADGLTEQVRAIAGGPLSPSGQQLIVDAITNQTGAGGASMFAIVTFIWSAIKVFRGGGLMSRFRASTVARVLRESSINCVMR